MLQWLELTEVRVRVLWRGMGRERERNKPGYRGATGFQPGHLIKMLTFLFLFWIIFYYVPQTKQGT